MSKMSNHIIFFFLISLGSKILHMADKNSLGVCKTVINIEGLWKAIKGGGGRLRVLGTDHVISGPMKDLVEVGPVYIL